jgi:hypothetical protein
MISTIVPPIAVQIVSRAMNIPLPSSDAGECFNLLKKDLKQFNLRKTKGSKEQVVFTAQHAQSAQRVITIVLSCTDIEKETAVCSDTLYLNLGGARLMWAYVAGTLSQSGV